MKTRAIPEQMGFLDEVFVAQRDAHLPETMPDGIAYYRGLLDRYNVAVLAGDQEQIARLENEAHRLAEKLNGGDVGIMGHKDAPAYVLERETAAPTGSIPMWGQKGAWTVTVEFPAVPARKKKRAIPATSCAVRIEFRGLFGFGGCSFACHVVDAEKPFVGETGYRSVISNYAGPLPVDQFVIERIRNDVALTGGRLLDIKPEYRERRKMEKKSV